jgi:competence protein ComFC
MMDKSEIRISKIETNPKFKIRRSKQFLKVIMKTKHQKQGTKTIPRWYKQLKRIVQLSIFLPTCKGCGNHLVFEDEDILCEDCREKIANIRYHDSWLNTCQHCGRTLDHQYERCGECILQSPPYRKHRSYSRYQDLLRHLILIYKYRGIEKLKCLFVDYYIELFAEKINEDFDYIVPVPPDRGRKRKREFNPILEIAKILSRRLEIPLSSGNLIKIKQTLPQAGLTRAQRITNLDGAFKLKHPGKIKGKKLLLIDDVYTTGTTINKCAQLLIKQKADVVALTLARS